MPYIKKTITSGAVVEIEKYYTYRVHGTYIHRSPKQKPTKPEMLRENQRNAHKQLRRLLNANFCPGDYSLVLTYSKDNRPATPEELRKHIQNFLRKLKREYTKNNKTMKYVWVGQFGEWAAHAHMVTVKGVDIETISALWGHGAVHCTPMYGKDYIQLADYLIKHSEKSFMNPETRVHGKRWCNSLNLDQPKITREIVKADSWTASPKAPQGWQLNKDSLFMGVSDITGYPYQYYQLTALNPNAIYERIRKKTERIRKKTERKERR